MCGICGIVQLDNGPVDPSLVQSMTERLHHRGPDDGGVWFGGDKSIQVGLGSRRLSIIDLSPRGHMPMPNHNRSIWITYNGEVFNFQEVRRELEAYGYRFQSDTDTEVILHAYEKWGPDCLRRFNGMFAFAIWDERDHSLFLARDRLGVKPLYYAMWSKRFVFASEIKALLENPELPRDLDLDALDLYMTFRIIPQPHTIFKAIHKLAPGYYLIYKNGHLKQWQYWDVINSETDKNGHSTDSPLPATRSKHDSLVARRELHDLVEDAVRLRLISDVPVGVLLSGGIDSTIIAGLMARLSGSRIKTFTLGFAEQKGATKGYDESAPARMTAKQLGSEHQELLITPQGVRDTIPGVLDHCDEPFASASAIPAYLVSKLARQGVKVALSGDGPDELFAGYRAYLLEPLSRFYLGIPTAIRGNLLEPVIERWPSSDATFSTRTVRRTQRFLRSINGPPAERFFRLTNKFNDVPPETIYNPKQRTMSLDLCRHTFKTYYEEPALKADTINRMLYVDSKIKLTDEILAKVDLFSMRVSLEVRTPFLDYRIARYAFRIPGSSKLKWLRKKYLLRETFKDLLPAHVLRLPKRGFEIPVGEWMKTELREVFLDTVQTPNGGGLLNDELIRHLYREHCENRRDHSEKLWIFFVLRWWARKNRISI